MISSGGEVGFVMGWTRWLLRWFPVVVALCLVAACSADEPDAGELPPGVVEGSPSLGVAPPTATPSPSTAAPVAACPNEEAVAGDPARQVGPGVTGDVDGDGAADRVHLAVDQAGAEGCSAFVVVDTAAGITDAAPVWEIGSQGGLPAPRFHGFANIDGRPGAEVLIDEAAGASTQFVGAFIYSEDGGLERVAVPGGPAGDVAVGAEDLFPYGGSVGHVEAVDCSEDGTIVISTATPSSAQSEAEQGVYEIERRFYVFDGTILERDEVETHRVPIARLDRFPEYSSSPFGSC